MQDFKPRTPKDLLLILGSLFVGIAAILAIVILVGQIKILGTDKYEGYNSISVTGTGEIIAVPDVAKFSYTIESDKKTLPESQAEVTIKSKAVVDALMAAGISKDDIKTENYSSYPKYEYVQSEIRACDMNGYCPPSYGKQILTGYTVSESVSVKVRDMAKVGDVAKILGDNKVMSLYGPNFEVDDIDKVRDEARAKAIDDARASAKNLARSLDVRLSKLVSYTDPEDSIYPMYEGDYSMKAGMGGDMAVSNPAPSLQPGTSTVTVRVMLTYRVK